MERKIAVITGGSRGIGLEAAKALSGSCVVYELSRRGESHDGITHISCDISDVGGVSAAIDAVIEKEGKIDILICSAGYGISGAVEFTDATDAKRQIDVNFFGTVNAVHAVLPHMRKAGGGRIICVSSVAGAIPIPFQTYYSVSKAAINSFVRALSGEVKPYGISVCAVMPGDTQTGFTAAREKIHRGDEEYGGRISRSVSGMEKDEMSGGSAAFAGKFIAEKALAKKVPAVCTIGFKYKLFVWLSRVLPQNTVTKMVNMMYAK